MKHDARPLRSTPVLVVGGGPIGLSLAADLGKRGVAVTVIEKNANRIGPAKMNLVGVRTMEFCRWLGIADKVSHWGFPEDFCMDNVFVAGSLNGWEIARIEMPPMGGPSHSKFSPERQRKCPQTAFDPIMRDCADAYEHVQLRYRTQLESFVQHDDCVLATVRDRDTGEPEVIRAQYVVGADGCESDVRRLLAIAMRGVPHLDTSLNVEVDVLDVGHFSELHPRGNASRYAVVGPQGLWATFIPLDGYNFWRMTLYGANDQDVDKIDIHDALLKVVGRPFKYTVRSAGKWTRRMIVADRFQDGRVFLAGDAAHTHPPNGGFGMNTGIGDVTNLGWKLAAMLQGWGGPDLLASYDIERRPACHRAANESLTNYYRLTGKTAHPAIQDATPEGDAARAALGGQLKEQNTKAWQPVGIHLGYTYEPSPLVVPDGTPAPQDDTVGYVPTSRPGARAPHFWLGEGRSVLDLFGAGFTLLDFSGDADVDPFVREAQAQKLPLAVHRIDHAEGAQLYGTPLVLVRPDGHVCWRGDALPDDVARLLRRVRGADGVVAARWAPDLDAARAVQPA